MKKVDQKCMMSNAFRLSIEREQLLVKKYAHYYPHLKDRRIKEMVKEFKNTSRNHIEKLKDKMIKLNL